MGINSFIINPFFESEPFIHALVKLKQLPKGWHYGQGEPMQDNAFHKAIEIFFYFKYLDLVVEPFPDEDGGVILSYNMTDHFVDIEISEKGIIGVVQAEGTGRNYTTVERRSSVNVQSIGVFLQWLIKEPSSAFLVTVNSSPRKKPLTEVHSSRERIVSSQSYPSVV